MAKLIQCKTCGAEIAKTAKACPHCGAKQHQGTYAACAVVIILAFIAIVGVIAVSGSGSGSETQKVNGNNQSTGNSAVISNDEAAETINVSAEQLYSSYTENTVNADNLYKGKYLSVTGTITDIGQDLVTKKPCVSLDSGSEYGLYPVQCFFPSSSDDLANLRDGETVTIVGKCSGYNIAFVQLTGCELQTDN